MQQRNIDKQKIQGQILRNIVMQQQRLTIKEVQQKVLTKHRNTATNIEKRINTTKNGGKHKNTTTTIENQRQIIKNQFFSSFLVFSQ